VDREFAWKSKSLRARVLAEEDIVWKKWQQSFGKRTLREAEPAEHSRQG